MLCDKPIIIPSSGTYITDREMSSAYAKRSESHNILSISASNHPTMSLYSIRHLKHRCDVRNRRVIRIFRWGGGWGMLTLRAYII